MTALVATAIRAGYRDREVLRGVDLRAGAGELVALAARIETAFAAAGFPSEARPFLPHLTLGRLPEGGRLAAPPAPDLGTIRISEALLMRSDLSPRGATYTVLARAPLTLASRSGPAGPGGSAVPFAP